MLSLYGPFADIARFLSAPTKLCSITFDSEDTKKIKPFFAGLFADVNRDSADRITLDLKIKDCTLYFTEHGQSRSIKKLDFYLGNAHIYNTIVEKGLNDPSKIIFQGSLNITDIIKLFEVNGRHLRQNLCDEQFNAIYKEMINTRNASIDPKEFKESNVYVSWLSNILNMYTPYERITRMEADVLRREGLLNEDLVLKQKEFLKGKDLDYYLLKMEEPYWLEFMTASKKKNVPRSETELIRNTIAGCEIEGALTSKNSFKRIFDRYKDNDLSLEF